MAALVLLLSVGLSGSSREATEVGVEPVAPLGHVGGAALDVAVDGGTAYLGYAATFMVLDIRQTARPQWLAELPLATNAIALDGQYAYLAGRQGLHVVEIADPAQPHAVATLPFADPLSDVAVAQGYVYTLMQGNLHIVDARNPPHLRSVAQVDALGRFTQLDVRSGSLFVAGEHGIYVFDVSTPQQPVELTFHATDRPAYGPVLTAEYALFLVGGRIHEIPFETPVRVKHGQQLAVEGFVSAMRTHQGHLYLANGSFGLQVWDIQGPKPPTRLAVFPTRGMAQSVALQGDDLFLLDSDEGLRILRVASPHSLIDMGAFPTLGYAYEVVVHQERAFVAAGFHEGLHVIDVNAPQTAHNAREYGLPGEVRSLALVDNSLFALASGQIVVLDVTRPHLPASVFALPDCAMTSVVVQDHHLFLGDPMGRLTVAKLTEPNRLQVIGQYPGLQYGGVVAVHAGTVYLWAVDQGLQIMTMDATGHMSPRGLYPTSARITAIAVQDNVAYLAASREGVLVIDVTDPTRPRRTAQLRPGGRAVDLLVQEERLFVAFDSAGAHIYDLTEAMRPVAVGRYATCGNACALAAHGGVLYVAESHGGLSMFALTTDPSDHEPTSPTSDTDAQRSDVAWASRYP